MKSRQSRRGGSGSRLGPRGDRGTLPRAVRVVSLVPEVREDLPPLETGEQHVHGREG
jgi:hypothetical protein